MTPSKSEAAYATISERINNGAYSPGYRLVLGTIAEELGCSVVPVREAIRRLEAEGLVNFTRNVGARWRKSIPPSTCTPCRPCR